MSELFKGDTHSVPEALPEHSHEDDKSSSPSFRKLRAITEQLPFCPPPTTLIENRITQMKLKTAGEAAMELPTITHNITKNDTVTDSRIKKENSYHLQSLLADRIEEKASRGENRHHKSISPK